MNRPNDVLEDVALSIAGEDGCCDVRETDGRCCMTDRARAALAVIEARCGLTLSDLERRAAERDAGKPQG